jgi:transcription initiation factor TFIIB
VLISEENIQRVCKECNSANLYLDPVSSELVCEHCGMVISGEQLSRKPEWRAFDFAQREKLPRVGSPLNLTIHDKGLSTSIGWRNRDHSGKRLSPEANEKLYRLRKLNRKSKFISSGSKNLSHALSVMIKLGNKLNLPRNVVETTSIIYRRALGRNIIRGRTIQNIVVAAIYTACRQCGVLRSLTDVAKAANIPRKIAARNYRFLHQELELEVPNVQVKGYIRRLVSRLGLLGDTEILALRLVEVVSNTNQTSGRSPAGIAASCIYVSSRILDEGLTQKQLLKKHKSQKSQYAIDIKI